MKYSFISYKNPATEVEIQEWERATSIQLPRQYRDFMLQSNGAGTYPEWGFQYLDPDTGRPTIDGIDSFYSLNHIIPITADLTMDAQELGTSYHLLTSE